LYGHIVWVPLSSVSLAVHGTNSINHKAEAVSYNIASEATITACYRQKLSCAIRREQRRKIFIDFYRFFCYNIGIEVNVSNGVYMQEPVVMKPPAFRVANFLRWEGC